MKNIALLTLLAVMATAGVLVACGGGESQPANSPSNASSAAPAESAAPAGSAAPATPAK